MIISFWPPCLSLRTVQQCRSPWPSHGASLPPAALWSIAARLPRLRSFHSLLFPICLLSNPTMTGASLKIHHIQITLISFTLFIYFLCLAPPPFFSYSAVSWWAIEEQVSPCESVNNFFSQPCASAEFSISCTTFFGKGVPITNSFWCQKNVKKVCLCLSLCSLFFFKLQFLHLTWVAFLWEIIMIIAEGSPGDCRASLYRLLVSWRQADQPHRVMCW